MEGVATLGAQVRLQHVSQTRDQLEFIEESAFDWTSSTRLRHAAATYGASRLANASRLNARAKAPPPEKR